jgi:hypothetical protein
LLMVSSVLTHVYIYIYGQTPHHDLPSLYFFLVWYALQIAKFHFIVYLIKKANQQKLWKLYESWTMRVEIWACATIKTKYKSKQNLYVYIYIYIFITKDKFIYWNTSFDYEYISIYTFLLHIYILLIRSLSSEKTCFSYEAFLFT